LIENVIHESNKYSGINLLMELTDGHTAICWMKP
jgi:hypothetical protein